MTVKEKARRADGGCISGDAGSEEVVIGIRTGFNRDNTHPLDKFIRTEVIAEAWCPGCGIGIAVNSLLQATARARIDPARLHVVSGLGCAGRIAAGLEFGAAQATEVFPVEYALRSAGHERAEPVVVFVSDADLLVHGAEAFLAAARAAPEILVVYVNTMVYPVVYPAAAAQPPVPGGAYASAEIAFNIPHLAQACGAHYIARWTTVHARRLSFSIAEALRARCFSVIEVVTPCLMYHAKHLPIRDSLDRPRYLARAALDHQIPVRDLDLRRNGAMVIGVFRRPDQAGPNEHESASGR